MATHGTAQDSASIFDTARPLRQLPYWVFWTAAGLLLFVAMEISSRLEGESFTLGTRILAVGFAAIPVIGIALTNELKRSWRQVRDVFWDDEAAFDRWFNSTSRFLFTGASWQAKVTVVLVFFFAIATLVTVEEQQHDSLTPALGVTIFIAICVMCGKALFMCMGSIVVLHGLVQRPMRVPFFYPPTRAIRPLTGFYSLLALAVTGAYAGLAIAIWQGPYPLDGVMLLWVTFMAFVPLTVFALSTYMIRGATAAAKDMSIAAINAEILEALDAVEIDDNKDNLERLEKLMELQDKVEAMREWPIAVSGAITLLIALAAAVIQAILAIVELRGG